DMPEAHNDRIFAAPTIGITYATLNEGSQWGLTPEVCEQLGMKRELETAMKVIPEMKRRGIRVLPGGDYGFAWNPIGTNARDLEHFVKLFGYSPIDAILPPTSLAAHIMIRAGQL